MNPTESSTLARSTAYISSMPHTKWMLVHPGWTWEYQADWRADKLETSWIATMAAKDSKYFAACPRRRATAPLLIRTPTPWRKLRCMKHQSHSDTLQGHSHQYIGKGTRALLVCCYRYKFFCPLWWCTSTCISIRWHGAIKHSRLSTLRLFRIIHWSCFHWSLEVKKER